MARKNKDDEISKKKISSINKDNRQISSNLNGIVDKLQSTFFGNVFRDDVQKIHDEFNDILNNEINSMNVKNGGDVTSFISKLVSNSDKNQAAMTQQIKDFLEGDSSSTLSEDMQNAYRNNMIKRSDLHEISSKLIELRNAIKITTDSIVSSDVSNGMMSRTLNFGNNVGEHGAEYISMVEDMEEKFNLQRKIKNFIIPYTLEQGKYYTYHVPYSKLFEDFNRYKKEKGSMLGMFSESVMDINTEHEYGNNNIKAKQSYSKKISDSIDKNLFSESELENFDKEIGELLSHISVNNEPVHLPFIEVGLDSMEQMFIESGMIDDNDTITEETSMSIEAVHRDTKKRSRFSDINKLDDGVLCNDTSSNSNKGEFSNIKDCYFKMFSAIELLPIKIVDTTIGYFRIFEDGPAENRTELGESLFSAQYYRTRKTDTLSDVIATEIIKSFDKKFLEDNSEFKELIIEAINYYNINERKLKFQFIPKEYIVEHKVNEDEKGEGHSIIEPSLFYAKLYLVLLLFKMMSIVDYSNDTRVHYLRTSGLDKNISNKVQEIARKMQSRHINILDMFSYTTLVNKIGSGTDRYVPIGRNDVRGIESEVIAGQDVQLNTEIMEMLRTAYISSTGCPAVIMNYLNEADFAKSIELGNAQFTDLIISDQLDFNESITKMYRLIMKYSTDIPEEVINTFKFAFAAPKASSANITRDMLDTFDMLYNSMIPIVFGIDAVNQPENYIEELRLFRIKLIRMQLPMINIDAILEFAEDAKREAVKDKLEQKQKTSENGDEPEGGY